MNDLLADSGGSELPIEDGELRWWPAIDLGGDNRDILRQLIDDCAWRQEQITVYGKPYLQPRLSAWYGDLGYRYSGIELQPLPMPPLLLDIKARVERATGHGFNSVLLNYYRNGQDRMGMHSDDERELGPRPVIASLSLGETRRMLFRHRRRKDLETLRLDLSCGSLLLMSGETQSHWRHGINAEKRATGARINLTFRQILPEYGRPASGRPASGLPASGQLASRRRVQAG